MRILNGAQMREADRRTIEDLGIPSIVLMENAARQVVAAIDTTFDDLPNRRITVVCGRGSNGGDGFVVARALKQRGIDVSVFLLARVAEVAGDARLNLNILGRLGLPVVEVPTEPAWKRHFSEISDCDVIVDAIFGTGLTKPLGGMFQIVVADLNGSGIPIVSVDLPSGLSADTHELIGEAIQASLTVTLAAPKLPLVLPPGNPAWVSSWSRTSASPQRSSTRSMNRARICSRGSRCAHIFGRVSPIHTRATMAVCSSSRDRWARPAPPSLRLPARYARARGL